MLLPVSECYTDLSIRYLFIYPHDFFLCILVFYWCLLVFYLFFPFQSEKPGSGLVNVDFLQKKVKTLEDENLNLRLEVILVSYMVIQFFFFCLLINVKCSFSCNGYLHFSWAFKNSTTGLLGRWQLYQSPVCQVISGWPRLTFMASIAAQWHLTTPYFGQTFVLFLPLTARTLRHRVGFWIQSNQ